jgi:hypothetical protein
VVERRKRRRDTMSIAEAEADQGLKSEGGAG